MTVNSICRGCTQKACLNTEFTCKEDQACIEQGKVCNGYPDCSDGSDEGKELCGAEHTTDDGYTTEGSDTQGCLPSEFECDDGLCIDQRSLCDGRSDCDHGEDEDQRRCYPNSYTTERISDGPTEAVPQPQGCLTTEFECRDRKCIDIRRICDGRSDCEHGEDEDQNICYLGTLATEPNADVERPTEPFYEESFDQHNSNAESTTEYCK